MPRADDLHQVPDGLPAPVDDGACDHLPGTRVPPVELPAASGRRVRLDALPGRTVVYCYPRTGTPGEDPPPGWDAIPGARGCTPETCAFRDNHGGFVDLGVRVLGVSTQTTAEQREMADRLAVPFEVLSDADLRLARALDLPTFEVAGMTLIKRLTLVLDDGAVTHAFYPVFPPDRHATEVLAWLGSHRREPA
jgi:peroxiredoxin